MFRVMLSHCPRLPVTLPKPSFDYSTRGWGTPLDPALLPPARARSPPRPPVKSSQPLQHGQLASPSASRSSISQHSSTSTPIILHRCSRPSFNHSQKSSSTRACSFCFESSWSTQERATKRCGPVRRTQYLLACGGSRSGGQRRTWWSLWGRGTIRLSATRTSSRRTPVLARVAHPPSPCAILRRAQDSSREDHPRRRQQKKRRQRR